MKSRTKGNSATAQSRTTQMVETKKLGKSKSRSRSPMVKSTLTPDRAIRKATKTKQPNPEITSAKEAMRKLMQNYQADLLKFESFKLEAKERESNLIQENEELRDQLKMMRNAVGSIKKGQKEINEERFMLIKDAEKKQRLYEQLGQRFKGTIAEFVDEISNLAVSQSPSKESAKTRSRLLKILRETEAAVGLNLQQEMESLAGIRGVEGIGGTRSRFVIEPTPFEYVDNLQSFCDEPKEWDYELTADCTGRSAELHSFSSLTERSLP